jgi:ATP-dependent helicase/nuclease subunit A
MNTVPHQIIRASAGTGKTFALSDRIVRLLALGVAPDSLVALTFTRKAAAEFVAAVFRKLAEAALDENAAANLAGRLQLPARTSAAFATTLGTAVASMNRLQFGTLDAFFQRVAGTIPFELGLSGPIQILDQAATDESREHALRQLLHEGIDETARRTLLEAFRAATWGADEKQLFPRLLGFVEAGHDLFLEAPRAAAWGAERTLWPKGCPWLPPPDGIDEAMAELSEFATTLDGRFGSAMRKFADEAARWQPGMDLPGDAVSAQFLAQLAGPDSTEPLEIIYYRKPCVVPGRIVPLVQRIVRHYLGRSLAQALLAAQGMHRLIAGFNRLYQTGIRATGRLAFADVVELLRHADPTVWQPRLDSRLAHWLFDEFQDTSVVQWSVLTDLVDEVLQDPSGERSVFFVGDPKQAIYRWRGGEHRLLTRISARYGEVISVLPLDKSFRSAPAVIDFVNRVGGTVQHCRENLPAPAIDEWIEGWSPHVSAVTTSEGFVRIHEIEEKEAIHDALLASLLEVDPIRRGLTCAILTRGNDEATTIAQELRARGFLDVAAETDVSITTDQPMTQALLALISAAAHPADMASRRVVEMSPLAQWLDNAGGWDSARGHVLLALTTRGYESTLREIVDATLSKFPVGRFGARRIEQLLALARGYDAGESRSPDDFVRHAREATLRETASAGRVQVMTIHKAKGLGFDFVLLPMGNNRRLDAVESDPLLVSRDENHLPEWILGRPPALVIEADSVLTAAQDKRRTDAAYESLCVLYVALTRARFGLHVFLGSASTNASTLSAGDLIRRGIGKSSAGKESSLFWEHGDSAWFEHDLREPPTPPIVPGRADWSRLRPVQRLTATLPSRSGAETPHASPAAAFGAEVHEAFAAIEWQDNGTETLLATFDRDILSVVHDCLAEPAIAVLFQRVDSETKVWRERRFDIVLDGRWISGVFDRVVLSADRVTLVDFKTDSGSADAARERHEPQMQLYRAALASLTGIQTITALLVHTSSRSVIEIPAR